LFFKNKTPSARSGGEFEKGGQGCGAFIKPPYLQKSLKGFHAALNINIC